jgi:hypothetical protein
MNQDSAKKFFDLFLSGDQFRTLWMLKPFTLDGLTAATDTTSIGWVNRELEGYERISDESKIGVIKDYISKKDDEGRFIKTRELVSLMEGLPLIDEYNEEDEKIVCKTCNGDGEVEWGFEHYTMDHECPVCEGEGSVDNTARKKTGNMIPDLEEIASIGETRLSFHRIKSLIAAAEILGVEEIEIIYLDDLNRLCPVTFGLGEARVLLMPMSTSVSTQNKITIHQKTV